MLKGIICFLFINSFGIAYAQYPKWILGNSQQTTGGSFYTLGPGNLAFFEVDYTVGPPAVTQRILGASVNNIPSMGTLDVIDNGIDSNGNVLFYLFCAAVDQWSSYGGAPSDTVYFVAYDPATGADEVFGKVSGLEGQASVIEHGLCPRPGFNGQYYFIYKTHLLSNTFDDVKYVIVDGINKTVSAPVTIVSGQKTGEGFAVSNLYCPLNNHYLFTSKLESNGNITIRASEITSAGIGPAVNAHTVAVTNNSGSPVITAIEVSPLNNMVAVCLYTSNSNKSVALLDFTPATGALTNERFYLNQAGFPIVTCEFSADGSRLYIMQGGSSSFPNSVFNCPVIATGSLNFNPAFVMGSITIAGSLAMERAFDGSIYVSKGQNYSDMFCITNPNSSTPTVVTTASPFFNTSTWRIESAFPDQIDGAIIPVAGTGFITGPASVCSGDSATLSINGGTSVNWLSGATGSSLIISVAPTITTDYIAEIINPCDTIIDTLTLVVNPVYLQNTSASICQGDTYSFGTQTLTVAGNYTHTFTIAGGCDSTVNLALSVLPASITTFTQTICNGDTAVFDGQSYTQTGTYSHAYTGVNGCDSILELTLTVLPTYNLQLSQSICDGDTLMFDGQSLFQSGIYNASLQSINGCDSLVELNLTVVLPYTGNEILTICSDDSLLFGTQVLTVSGNYSNTFISSVGCDSTVNLSLTVLQAVLTQIDTSICAGDIFTYNGQTYTLAGSYPNVFTATNGCDSTVVLNLTILPSPVVNLSQEICEGDTVVFNGQQLFISDTYLFTFTLPTGCDSTIIYELIVHPLPTAAFEYENFFGIIQYPVVTFENQSAGNVLQLWNFGDGSISTELNPVHQYPDTGQYTVTLIVTSAFGCSDTLAITIGASINYFSFYAPNSFTPDGDGLNDVWTPMGNGIICDEYELMIFNRWGQLIFESDCIDKGWDGTHKGIICKTDVYVWKAKVRDIDGIDHQYYGHITLLR